MTKKIILLQAAPFCFGPISTLLNVVQAFVRPGYQMIVIEEGPTRDLIRRSRLPLERVTLTTAPPFSAELAELIDQAELVVSNTDPLFAAECMTRGAKVVVIDTLFWMWDHIPPILSEAECYIAQDFYGIEAQLERLGRPRNFLKLGPLTSTQGPPIPLARRANSIQISFGGCDCLLVDPRQDPYPGLMLKLMEDALTTALPQDWDILLCCGERAARSLQPQDSCVTVGTLSNRAYLKKMRQAKAILLSPGLTGTLEVLQAETPVFFFPPQNYSQALQLSAYRKANVAPYSFTWTDVYPEFALPPYLPEEEAVDRVRAVIARFVQDEAAQDVLRHKLVEFLQIGIQNYDPVPARMLFESLGREGPVQAARAIEGCLNHR
jgi:hypothetical protein